MVGYLAIILSLAIGDSQNPLDEADRVERDLRSLESRIESLREELATTEGERRELFEQLLETEAEIKEVAQRRDALEQEIRQHNAELQQLQQRQSKILGDADRHAQLLAGHIRAAYAAGQQLRLRLWMSRQAAADLGRLLGYSRALSLDRAEQLAQTQTSAATLAELTEALIRSRKRLRDALDEVAEKQTRSEELLTQRREILRSLGERIEAQSDQLIALRADEQRLRELLVTLRDLFAEMPSQLIAFDALRGSLPRPAQGALVAPQRGELSAGVFIDAAAGEPVRAVARGRVAFADWLRGYGLLMILDHGDGYLSLYAFNEQLFGEVGDWVEPGSIIASVGASGGRQQAGLYFELRRYSEPISPRRWFVSS